MAYVYLIGENSESNFYKIGVTKKNNITERKKELQTGNPNELIIVDYFETTNPYKLEKMLHNHFWKNNELNEWFYLDNNNVSEFKSTCEKYQYIIDSLKNNPFFNKNKKQISNV